MPFEYRQAAIFVALQIEGRLLDAGMGIHARHLAGHDLVELDTVGELRLPLRIDEQQLGFAGGQDIGEGDQAQQMMVVVNDGDVADPLLLHQVHRLFDAVLRTQGEGLFCHDFG